MQASLLTILFRALCEKYGKERAMKIVKEVLGAIEGDPKDFLAAVGSLVGFYDKQKKALKRYLYCIDFKELFPESEADDEYVYIGVDPDPTIIEYRDKQGALKLAEVLGEEGLKIIADALMSLTGSPKEIEYSLKVIEGLWRHVPYILDFYVIDREDSYMLVIVYADENIAKNIEAFGNPGPITYTYAFLRGLLNGYKPRFKRVRRDGTTIIVEFEKTRKSSFVFFT